MPSPQPTTDLSRGNPYGAASRYRFDDPSRWHTEIGVPILDEHDLTNENGEVVGRIGKDELEQIARNNNKRILQTGDPATLILGHTSDHPGADEKPAKGFAVNYRVRPFKRNEDGQIVYAIHADFKVRPQNRQLLEEYPRRSVELWLSRKEIDPIALLGGTTPERDLGVVVRNQRANGGSNGMVDLIRQSRLSNIVIDNPQRTNEPDTVIRYSAGQGSVLRYAMHTPHKTIHNNAGDVKPPKKVDYAMDDGTCDDGMTEGVGAATPSRMEHGGGKGKGFKTAKKLKYDDATMGMDTEDRSDTHPLPDEAADFENEGELEDRDAGNIHGSFAQDDMDPAAEDPMVAKVFQSKMFGKMLEQAVMSALEQLLAEEGGGNEPVAGGEMIPPSPAAPPMGGAGGPDAGIGEEAGMDGADGLAPPAPEQEDRMDHEAPPVKFGAGPSSVMAGPSDAFIPAMGTKGTRYARQPNQQQPSKTNTGSRPMAAPQTAPRQPQQNPEVLKMSRQLAEQTKLIKDLQIKNARSEAREAISALQHQGIVINDPEDEIELLASIPTEAGKKRLIDKIKNNYARVKDNDPAAARNSGSFIPLAQYARGDSVAEDGRPENDEDYDNYQPKDGNEARILADIQTGAIGGEPRSYGKAVKFMKKKLGDRMRMSRNGTH